MESVDIALYILIIMLFILCIFMCLKIYFFKRAIKEISDSLNDILNTDTNNLINISSSDEDIKKLATTLNINLKELRKQKLQYENGNQELKRVVTNISHDLRTPLTAINGYIDLMKNDKLSKEQEKYLSIIYNKSNELIELTEQLFDYSKAIDNNVELNKEKCCMNEVLEEVLVSYYTVFKENGITPEISICENKIYKMLNKASVVRIFENILSNISKYSNGNFKAELGDNGIITFSNKARMLDATTVEKIFDRYFTVENAKKSTGLGLSIAKQLVELNGGKIVAKYIDENLIIQIMF